MVVILQRQVSLDDSSWNYQHVQIPMHKPARSNKSSDQYKVPIKFITVTEENGIVLDVISQTTNRVLSKNNPESFAAISFEKFQFNDPNRNKTAGYIEKLLNTGIRINGVSYYFYGHSNSQLKKKVCYLVAARNGAETFKMINELGDFSTIASVAKRAKRIGLLFSAANSSFQLDEKKCLDIDDVEYKGHVFTDGCGLLSKNYAKQLSKLSNIVFRNDAYTPSVYQIRYKGYKGTLMVAPTLVTEQNVHFRASMKKFTSCPDNTFSVLDYSKPYTFGYLNGELVTLLSTLGISDEVFLRKQQEYFTFLQNALLDPHSAFIFLSYKGEHEMAEKVLNGIAPLQESIRRLQKEEWKGSYDKKDKERVRIMIRKSRLLYGVADYTGALKEGEVLVRITTEGKGVLTLDGAEVIVGRNPCLHPGDIRKFRAVRNDSLGHLEDCIVFPTTGTRDAASLMSGGDLDGDRFFVTWDGDIIPEKLYEPYAYPPAKEIQRREVRQADMIRYFANYNNASLGKVKNLYLSWARCSSDVAGSKECQELNALFSSCVDGERITIPERLQNAPELPEGRTFVLDTLCDNVKLYADREFITDTDGIDETPEELLENLLVSSEVCLNEFELFQMTSRWCRKNLSSLEEYLHCFDFGAFTHQQKHLAMQQFESSIHKENISRQVFNGLTRSDILSRDDIRCANLDDKRIHWQKLYSSYDDDGIRLETNISKALELFERKFIVFRVDEFLRVGIYFPQRLVKNEELFIGEARDSAKLFAFAEDIYKTWTNKNYKLYFDGDMIQLYDKHRRNTFVWLGLQNGGGGGKFPSKNVDTEFKVSIALQKFSGRLSNSRAKVTKHESKGMELYVLSNRDRVGHQILDITMSQRDTREIVRLLNDIPKEYSLDVAIKEDVCWVNREFCSEIVLRDDFSKFAKLTSVFQLEQIFHIYHEISHEKFTRAVDYVIKNFNSFQFKQEMWQSLFDWMDKVPIISCLVIEALSDHEHDYPMEKAMYITLVHAVIRTANFGKELVSSVFQNLIQILVEQNIKFDMNDLTKMVKTVVFCVRHVNVADNLLNQLLDEESEMFELTDVDGDHDICFKYFKDVASALAKDLIGEVGDKCPCDNYGIPQGAEDDDENDGSDGGKNSRKTILSDYFPTKLCQQTSKFYGTKPEPAIKCLQILPSDKEGVHKVNLRTDVSMKIRNGDHLRFCASRRSTNSPDERISVFDAVADSVQNGVLNFKLKQPAPREIYAATWNMYCCANTITFNAMLSATKILVTLKSDSTAIYKSILGLPQGKETTFPFDLKQATFQESSFNENQRRAIHEALNNHLTLIWGPPGTGKTTVIVEIMLQFLLHRNDLRILLAASTHNAVDNVLSRFVSQRKARFNDEESGDIIRIASDTDKVSKQMKKWTLDAFVGADIYKNNKAMREAENRLANASIVFSTCSAAGVGLLRGGLLGDDEDTKNKKKHEQHFDVVIVDEASQITEPNALVPIVKHSKFVVLVGDHKQLRPSVSEIAKDSGLETSLFEKLYTSEAESPHCKKIMLNMQFRMHEALARFPSEKFYDGILLTGVKSVDRIIPESQFPWPHSQDGIKFPAVFVDCLDLENHQVGSKSKKNIGQCQVTHDIIKVLRAGDANKHLSITVLSPYTMQVSELRHRLVGGNVKVDVETVDSFQGRESDIIIYTTVVANTGNRLGFLDDARRMNVAITRAKFGLILIGHKRTLTSNKLWKSCIEDFCEEVKFPNKS